jgi:hypothetical protein
MDQRNEEKWDEMTKEANRGNTRVQDGYLVGGWLVSREENDF